MPRVVAQLKMLLTIIFVLVSSLMAKPRDLARAFHWLSTSWMKLMNVAGLLIGPNGITVYVHLIASGPWKASFSWLAKATASWWYPIWASKSQWNFPIPNSSLIATPWDGVGNYSCDRVEGYVVYPEPPYKFVDVLYMLLVWFYS